MMYRFLTVSLLVLSLAGCEQQSIPTDQVYPWQITLLPEGQSRVFGIEFGRTTLRQVRAILGTRHDEAVFENPDGSLALEVYFNEVTLGGLSGKFILTLQATSSQLANLKQQAGTGKRMESGAIRYRLGGQARQQLFDMPVSALVYIPYTDLDEPLVEQRFGSPAEIIPVATGKRHFLYPAKGLDLLLDAEGKELLQYVAPRHFARLRQPLLKQANDSDNP